MVRELIAGLGNNLETSISELRVHCIQDFVALLGHASLRRHVDKEDTLSVFSDKVAHQDNFTVYVFVLDLPERFCRTRHILQTTLEHNFGYRTSHI